MANKIFSIYSNENYQPEESDHLIIETGNNHICLVVKSRAENVNALEWFTYTDEENQNLDNLFREFVDVSALLGKTYASTTLFINNDCNVLIPSAFFKADLIDDYLYAALGECFGYSTGYDRFPDSKGPVNVYRFKTSTTNYIKDRFEISQTQHTYSRLLEKWLLLKNKPDVLMNIIFYEGFFLLAVFEKGALQIMHAFPYQVAEDVVYHWLNLVKQLGLNSNELIIRISGVIDIPSALHSMLLKYFKNVTIETIQLGKINLTCNQYPLHYFTPLFNLAI
ncbi:MAG: DUF3822 family protein [Chitinophagaceae bacterium]|nr:DUF3822 family protein [Chitinophagaceae bacterium]